MAPETTQKERGKNREHFSFSFFCATECDPSPIALVNQPEKKGGKNLWCFFSGVVH
jgi:hypothetical protein